MPELIKDASIFIFIILCSFLIDYKRSIKYWYILLLIFIIGFADNLFNDIIIAYPFTQIIKSNIWNNYLYCNWSAKIYSIAFTLILLFLLKNIITPGEIGFRIKQNDNSIRFSLIVILCFFIIASTIGILSNKGAFDTKTLLFLLIMPGLNEEIIYRGFLLGLLNKIFNRNFKLLGTSFGWGAILISIAFGLLHGFNLSANYKLQFDYVTIILTGSYGFIYALVRERSGSLVFPVIAHSTVDFFNFFFRMI